MTLLLLASLDDDTIFIIVLGVVLVFALYQLVCTPDGLRVVKDEPPDETGSDFEHRLLEKLDRTNALLISTRNSLLILIILLVVLAGLYLILR